MEEAQLFYNKILRASIISSKKTRLPIFPTLRHAEVTHSDLRSVALHFRTHQGLNEVSDHCRLHEIWEWDRNQHGFR